METAKVAVGVVAVAVEEANEGPQKGKATQRRNYMIIYFNWDQTSKQASKQA